MELSDIAPLDGSFLSRIDADEPWTEKVSKVVPILGWIVLSHLWTKRVGPIRRRLSDQLVSRPPITRRAWEGDARYRAIAQIVCEVAQTEMGWPTDAFIAQDSFGVVFWSYDDGLDMEWAMIKIEEQLGIKISDAHIAQMIDKTLGEFVAYLAERSPALTNP
jgi:hypothetical protein